MSSQLSRDGGQGQGAPPAGRPKTAVGPREGVRRPKVLLAEDHDDTRDALTMLLELQGYDVLPARDGTEALRLAMEASPDVVITDYDMPKLDGAGLARRLRSMASRFGNVPILLLTALSRKMVEQAMEAGADAYISKPVDFQTLEATLRVFTGR